MQYAPPGNSTTPDEHYADANPALGIEGSIVPAAAIEPAMREIVNAITEAGLTPDADDWTQLAQAIRTLGMREATTEEIGGGYLAESINDPRLLAFTNAEQVKTAVANAAGANSIPTYYPGEFKNFFEETPPEGWAVRDGSVLAAADVNFPELWAELQKTENAFKLKSLSDWNALSAAAGGIGGVPYFVVDTTAMTIKLPDTRTDFFRSANGNVGDWQGDAVGSFNTTNSFASSSLDPTGGFNPVGADSQGQVINTGLHINTVNPETRPRNIAMLGCVCIEPAKAQRNEATTTTPGAVYLASGADDQRTNAVPSASMAAGLGMPSDRYIDLTLGASGTSYTAPADGYYYLAKNVTASGQFNSFLNVTNTIVTETEAVNANQTFVSCTAAKDDVVQVVYNSAGSVITFRFIYAQGAY